MTTETTSRTLTREQGIAATIKSFANWQAIALIVIVVFLALTFDYFSDGVFLTSRNLSFLLRQAAVLGIVASGVAILIIMSEIDLSIGSAVYFVGVIAATCETTYGLGISGSLTIAILAGMALGAWQGFWISVIGVPSFIVTLTGLLAFRGVGLYWTDARTLAPLLDQHVNLSESFIDPMIAISGAAIIIVLVAVAFLRRALSKHRHGDKSAFTTALIKLAIIVAVTGGALATLQGYHGLPMAIVWTLAIVGALWFIMARTVFGRNAYMIGANRAAASLAGVNVRRNIFLGFLLMGALYGIGGILFTARLNASTAGDATFLELDAIAASVIGGVALSGGRGWIPAVLGGALLLSTIDNGMSVIGVSSFLQEIVKGAILLFAVAVDIRFRGSRR